MSTFDPAQHPRERTGQFDTKRNDPPAGVLTTTAAVDPYGSMSAYPSSRAAEFAGCDSFAAIDEVWKAMRAEHTGPYGDDLDARWGAVERGRQLRRDGHPGVPTALGRSAFAHAQNDVDLADLYAQATEEPPGDGEASKAFLDRWYAALGRDYWARRAELVAAGVVNGESPLV